MDHSSDDLRSLVTRIGQAVNARASGLWRVEGDRLIQVAFVPGPDLDPEVAAQFVEATRSVPRDRLELGIVRAAHEGRVAVSIARDLPAEIGSGRWLRAFGADRSVAVPLANVLGWEAVVLSVAVANPPMAFEELVNLIASQIQDA